MRVTHTATYDTSLAEVHAMLTDPAFREYAAQRTGAVSAEVGVEEATDGPVVTVDQVQPTAGVPSLARKFTGETTRAVQVERWTGPDRATLSVTTAGRPTELHGTLTLHESGGRTTVTFEGELTVTVPLVAGRLEALMAGLLGQGRDAEHEAGVAWLSRDR